MRKDRLGIELKIKTRHGFYGHMACLPDVDQAQCSHCKRQRAVKREEKTEPDTFGMVIQQTDWNVEWLNGWYL